MSRVARLLICLYIYWFSFHFGACAHIWQRLWHIGTQELVSWSRANPDNCQAMNHPNPLPANFSSPSSPLAMEGSAFLIARLNGNQRGFDFMGLIVLSYIVVVFLTWFNSLIRSTTAVLFSTLMRPQTWKHCSMQIGEINENNKHYRCMHCLWTTHYLFPGLMCVSQSKVIWGFFSTSIQGCQHH